MARLPRLAIGGLPHLVVQRGHNGQPVLLDAVDRAAYRDALREAATLAGVAIHAYGLFDSQVRLLVTPASAEGLSLMMQSVGRRYAAGFNRRHHRSGTLWDGRFRATVLDASAYFLLGMRYVEGGMPEHEADDGRSDVHSSAAHHLGRWIDPLVSDHSLYWDLGNTPFDRHAKFAALLREPLSTSQAQRIEAAVTKGWALGGEAFMRALASQSTRRLTPARPGRPRRSAGAT